MRCARLGDLLDGFADLPAAGFEGDIAQRQNADEALVAIHRREPPQLQVAHVPEDMGEVLSVTEGARKALLCVDELSDKEIAEIKSGYVALAQKHCDPQRRIVAARRSGPPPAW